MQSNDNTQIRVLALVVPLRERVGLITFSTQFEIFLIPLSDKRSSGEKVLLMMSPAKHNFQPDLEIPIDSLTVLYGENGWGKTHLMLDACKSLSAEKGERKVAVVWECGGNVYLDPGSIFKHRIQTNLSGQEILIKRVEAKFNSVFYTTSPFEANKRRKFKSEGVFDATPPFSPSNPFEGAALLKAYSKLPTDLSFINDAEIRLRTKVPSLRSLLEKILPSLKRAESGLAYLQDRQRRALSRLDELLYERAQQALVVALQIALKGGVARATKLLLQLADRLRLFDESNGSALPEEEAKHLATEDVVHFLSSETFLPLGNFYSPLVLFHFIDVDLPIKLRGLGNRTTLSDLSRAFEGLRESEWEMLDQASQLGLLIWSFRNLSSGQVALLMLFSSLSAAIGQIQPGNSAFLFIDEGEMFMHPAWQRRYISDLLDFLGKFPEVSQRLHVVLSTHSLIVAGDTPPNRLFDVKEGTMSNGFGYGPKDLLDHVYRVEEFQGTYVSRLMGTLIGHIRNDADSALTSSEAMVLTESIADERLRGYLKSSLMRRIASKEVPT